MKKMLARYRYMPARSAAVVFVVLALSFFAMAFQAAAAPAAASTTSVLAGIGKGALAGLLAAVIGWASQKKQDDGTHEDWEWPQAIATGVIGAGFGAFAAWKHISLVDAENLPWVPFVLAGVEQGLKAIFRNLKVQIMGAFGVVKAGSSGNPTTPPAPPKA